MKVWKWYKNQTTEQVENSRHERLEDRYPLYAFTNDKKYRDLFREMRKKECFIEIKSSMTEEEYVKFANNYRSCMLDMYSYQKFCGYTDERMPNMELIMLLTTWGEKEFTESQLSSFSDSSDPYNCAQTYPFPPMIFLDKYFKALYKLQYVDYWMLYTQAKITTEQEDMLNKLGIDIDYSYPEVEFDEFSAFVNLYGDTLKL